MISTRQFSLFSYTTPSILCFRIIIFSCEIAYIQRINVACYFSSPFPSSVYTRVPFISKKRLSFDPNRPRLFSSHGWNSIKSPVGTFEFLRVEFQLSISSYKVRERSPIQVMIPLQDSHLSRTTSARNYNQKKKKKLRDFYLKDYPRGFAFVRA